MRAHQTPAGKCALVSTLPSSLCPEDPFGYASAKCEDLKLIMPALTVTNCSLRLMIEILEDLA